MIKTFEKRVSMTYSKLRCFLNELDNLHHFLKINKLEAQY